MKKYQSIFVFIFLTTMVFTLVQSLPLLDDLFHIDKTVVNKKMTDPSTESDSTDDDSYDDDENDTDEFFNDDKYPSINLLLSNSKFSVNNSSYRSLITLVNTPPPKI